MTAKTFCDTLDRICAFRNAVRVRCCTLFTLAAFVIIAAVGNVYSFAPAPLGSNTRSPATISMTCTDERGQGISFRLSHENMLAYVDDDAALTVERIIHAGDHLVAFASGNGLRIAARIGSSSTLTRVTEDGARSEALCDRIVLPRIRLRAMQ